MDRLVLHRRVDGGGEEKEEEVGDSSRSCSCDIQVNNMK
jgi:hypothetical protein